MASNNGFKTEQRYDLVLEGGTKISGVVVNVEGDNIVVDDVLSGKKQTIDTKKISSATQVNINTKGGFLGGVSTGTGYYETGGARDGISTGYGGGGPTPHVTPNYTHPTGFGGDSTARKFHKYKCGCGKCGEGNCWI